MPLSENEQRLLEQIERALVEDDPKFASAVRSTDPRTYLRRRVLRSAFVFLLGLVVLVVGVVLNQVPLTVILGILGFLMMLFAALRGAADLRRISGRDVGGRRPGGRSRTGRSRPRTRTPFMERVEERWRRRWEDRP
ncbi:SNF family Na+-dependent transporter [Frankia canadensis]|uniref:SNF family Na+-dependent transporter n=1 Tax=Frankia canadensis TaxID=1836972 RepID=A0A2I2KTK1_9ACTN|nr:DUF3040 domain-containing protein [Frankia canadensis]SNQ48998.1 SNF family Na+-dependent transporter [Frankia canadensis]SOU56288.1 SNF family Na+-dependent transporter [Frankia canadensis]